MRTCLFAPLFSVNVITTLYNCTLSIRLALYQLFQSANMNLKLGLPLATGPLSMAFYPALGQWILYGLYLACWT
ncbi:hypothetical protein QL093DRAFT_2488610, partial [Fusarium oxysporum]